MSTAGSFQWSVRTPEGPQAQGTCEFIVVPTTRGELGVLAGHAALVACVVPGELRVTSGGVVRSYRVGAGLVEVIDDTVRLLMGAAPAVAPAPHSREESTATA
jgi:F-type H+-transporting ATPase subunit epsilon